MASYLIIDTIRTDCSLPGSTRGHAESHVSSVVLDRGGAYLVTDVYDFMDHGHTFAAVEPTATGLPGADRPAEPVSRMRCRHCGRPTLRLTADPSTLSELDLPAPRSARRSSRTGRDAPAPAVSDAPAAAAGRRRRGSRVDHYADNLSAE